MLKTPVVFSAALNDKLYSDGRALPLSKKDSDILKALLPEDSYTYLTLREPTGAEIVRAEHTCGGIVIDRGEDGTKARTFPRGTCVRFEMTPAVVKDMICNIDCCDGDCPCNPVESAGITLPPAKRGVAWSGTAVFTGDTPMSIATAGAPSWVEVKVWANYVTFSGVPTGTGSFSIAVTATNCDGAVAIQQGILKITE